MPRPAKKQRIQCEHYTWLLGKRGDVYIADGRANRPNLGRHSLASRDRADADRLLRKLDRHMAVRNGLIDADEREPSAGEVLPLAMGRQLYEDHVSRPRVTGGTRKSSQKRYRAVLDKFFEFLTERGVTEWSRVTPQVLQS